MGGAQSGGAMPRLMLFNDSLGIRIMGINGGVIGRKQGPYVQFFRQQGQLPLGPLPVRPHRLSRPALLHRICSALSRSP